MKRITIIISLMFICYVAKSQKIQKLDDLKSGRYFRNERTNKVTGNWFGVVDGNEVQFFINAKRTRYNTKDGDLNFETDAIFLHFKKFFYDKKDISSSLTKPLMLSGSQTSDVFNGLNIDGITNSKIIVKLYLIDKNTLKLENKVLDRDSLSTSKIATVLYPSITLTRVK